MSDSRQDIHTYINDNFHSYELKYEYSITKSVEPHLKYLRVDRFSAEVLPPQLLGLLIDYIHQCKNVEIYFAFGYLCIGYLDREYGGTMRLDAFINSQRNLEMPFFVPDQSTAAPGPVDKEFVPPEFVDLTNQVDKEFVLDPITAGAGDLDKVSGVQV